MLWGGEGVQRNVSILPPGGLLSHCNISADPLLCKGPECPHSAGAQWVLLELNAPWQRALVDRDSQRAPPSRHYQHDLETCQKYLFSGPHPAASDSRAVRGASGDREGALTGSQEQTVPISVSSGTPRWKLEIGHSGSVGSIDMVRSSESGLSSPSPLLNGARHNQGQGRTSHFCFHKPSRRFCVS